MQMKNKIRNPKDIRLKEEKKPCYRFLKKFKFKK